MQQPRLRSFCSSCAGMVPDPQLPLPSPTTCHMPPGSPAAPQRRGWLLLRTPRSDSPHVSLQSQLLLSLNCKSAVRGEKSLGCLPVGFGRVEGAGKTGSSLNGAPGQIARRGKSSGRASTGNPMLRAQGRNVITAVGPANPKKNGFPVQQGLRNMKGELYWEVRHGAHGAGQKGPIPRSADRWATKGHKIGRSPGTRSRPRTRWRQQTNTRSLHGKGRCGARTDPQLYTEPGGLRCGGCSTDHRI